MDAIILKTQKGNQSLSISLVRVRWINAIQANDVLQLALAVSGFHRWQIWQGKFSASVAAVFGAEN
jgi:hypothetical protein